MALDDTPEAAQETKDRLMATTAIVGGGATGGGVLQQLIHEYLNQLQNDPENTPDLTVNIYDKRGQYGFGGPYGAEPPVFRLNQPAMRMSIDVHDPGSFIAWFQDWQRGQSISDVAKARGLYQDEQKKGMTDAQFALNYPKEYLLAKRWEENSFLPRAFYGVYLRHEFQKTLQLADEINEQVGRKAINIVQHDASVDTLVKGKDGLMLSGVEQGEQFQQPFQSKADAAVIATGHQKNGFLAEYQSNPDYIDTPMTINMVKKKLSGITDNSRPVVIAGTSQSMLDGLAALDAIGYKGKIIAVSPGAAEPWPYDPVKEATPRTDFPLQYITMDAVKNIAQEDQGNTEAAVAAFRALLVKELYSPEALAAGPGHVLETLKASEAELEKACAECPNLFERSRSMIDEFEGNHTFEERFKLYMKYKSEGRLEVRSGRITGAAADLPSGFDVDVTNPVNGSKYQIKAVKLINSASMLRTPYYIDEQTKQAHSPDPVVESALQSGLLAVDTKTRTINAAAGQQGTMEIVGPAHGGAWGIPFTNNSFETAARAALQAAFDKARIEVTVPGKKAAAPRPPVAPAQTARGLSR